MKKFITAVFLVAAIGVMPVLGQDKEVPTKQGMPMKGSDMMMGRMKEMQGKMTEMHNGMSGMMKGQGMMKGDEMKGMGGMMGNMSGMMGDMGSMMREGKMTPEEMQNMSKMMGDTSAMMKQMSERMARKYEYEIVNYGGNHGHGKLVECDRQSRKSRCVTRPRSVLRVALGNAPDVVVGRTRNDGDDVSFLGNFYRRADCGHSLAHRQRQRKAAGFSA